MTTGQATKGGLGELRTGCTDLGHFGERKGVASGTLNCQQFSIFRPSSNSLEMRGRIKALPSTRHVSESNPNSNYSSEIPI